MNQLAVLIENLEFSYHAEPLLSLKHIEVQSGEVVFLYGPSGSGKSTFLELLSGVLKPKSG